MLDSAFFERPVSRVGDLFRDRRLLLGRLTTDVARELNIPLQYLEALEGSDYCAVPIPFTKPWLRVYSEHLGLAWENFGGKAIAEWQSRQRRCDLSMRISPPAFHRSLFQRSRLWVSAIAVGVAGIFYIATVVVPAFMPPPLSIDGLSTSSRTSKNTIELVVRSVPLMRVTLNGAEHTTDEIGVARVALDLTVGSNTVVLTAKRTHSRPQVVAYTIVRE